MDCGKNNNPFRNPSLFPPPPPPVVIQYSSSNYSNQALGWPPAESAALSRLPWTKPPPSARSARPRPPSLCRCSDVQGGEGLECALELPKGGGGAELLGRGVSPPLPVPLRAVGGEGKPPSSGKGTLGSPASPPPTQVPALLCRAEVPEDPHGPRGVGGLTVQRLGNGSKTRGAEVGGAEVWEDSCYLGSLGEGAELNLQGQREGGREAGEWSGVGCPSEGQPGCTQGGSRGRAHSSHVPGHWWRCSHSSSCSSCSQLSCPRAQEA